MSTTATASTGPNTNVTMIKTVADHTALVTQSQSSHQPLVLLFTASWHPPCAQMHTVLEQLAKQHHTQLLFGEIDAEGVSEVTEMYPTVESVPTTLLLKDGQVVTTLAGANAVELTNLVTKHSKLVDLTTKVATPPTTSSTTTTPAKSSTAASTIPPAVIPSTPEEKAELDERLSKLTRASPVMAFIKGTPDAPRCGFTKQLLALLKEQQIEFGSFDILTDNTVREGLKQYSNWPTYPQVYVNGELVGGLDVVKELAASGELAQMVPVGHIASKAGKGDSDLNERLKSLINSKRVMLFMKGTPSAPQCGFSNKAVALLSSLGCTDFGSFDIFSDNEVREGLKLYSNWPTYPQLYIDGELVGGLDVMQEMKESGELQEALNAPPPLEPKA